MADSEELKTLPPLKDWMREDLRKAENLLVDALGRVRLALLLDAGDDSQRRRIRDTIIDARSDTREAGGYLHIITERFD